jgi:hypothetical protein
MKSYKLKEKIRDLDYSQLLFSNRDVRVKNYPFFHGWIDNYLPKQIYQDLLIAFPEKTLFINYDAKSRYDDNHPMFKEFLYKNKLYKNLMDFFISDLFLKDLQKFTLPAVISARGNGNGGPKDWYYSDEWYNAPRSKDVTPIKVTMKFSHLTKDGWIQPHTDNPSNILTILIYFPEDDWLESYGGGTEIYVPKFPVLGNNWHNIDAPFQLMNRWDTIRFVPNRLVFFVKSNNSWHGVSPITCPKDKSRKSLMITIQLTNLNENPMLLAFYRILKNIAFCIIKALMRIKLGK